MYSLNSTKYSISIRGPRSWNDVFNKENKTFKIKPKLIEIESKTDYF